MKLRFLLAVIFAVLSVNAQITSEDETEKVDTEEIKLNVIAFDKDGKFVEGVKKEDLVILEDNVIHRAESVRRIPANILILLDTGGELRAIKSLEQTKKTANALIGSFLPEDKIAVMQYHDKTELISDWTTDHERSVAEIKKNINFGKRSLLTGGISAAIKMLQRSDLDNKHLILITDGTDSAAPPDILRETFERLLTFDVSVHVISYTAMEIADVAPRSNGISKTAPPKALPPEVIAQLPNGARDAAQLPTIRSISLDRELKRKLKERKKALETSEKLLEEISNNSNGEFLLPVTRDEMLEKAALVARMIDSSYVLTYIPIRPLSESKANEERLITVTSRKPDLSVEAKRKLIIKQ